MNHTADRLDPALAHLITALAAIVALALAVALPAIYFVSARATLYGETAAEAKLAASSVSQLASRNPDLWVFENTRIRGFLATLDLAREPEQRLVFSAGGQLVAEHGSVPVPPLLVTSHPVYDSGRAVGRVDVLRSQLMLLIVTAVIALLSGSLGAIAFTVLRSLPLRLLSRSLERSTHLATHDVLTGLPNRALFQDRLEQSLAWSRREGTRLAVLYLDLDRFKEINDTLGHAAGDRLLIGVTARLQACVRETDTLARLGGDEFAIVEVGAQQLADTEMLAQRLIDTTEEALDLDGNQVTIGASVGIALRTQVELMTRECDAGLMLQEADVALYRAKEDGRGTYRFFAPEMNQKLLERRALTDDMLTALETGHFRLKYQPQFDLHSRRIVGAEALIRWSHPQRGEIMPESFIPLAEETGLIVRIGGWVLHEACRQAAAWPDLPCMAINVSPVQFRRPGFVDQVDHALRSAGLAPARLEIEITEGVLLRETAETLATLKRLRALGVAIAMDDFGTGYSSLGYLQKFRFDKIKIDRSFVRDLGRDEQANEIVRAVLRMSHAMGIRVNAEGVEHEHQMTILHEEGCEEIQGFLLGEPVAPAAFTDLLANGGANMPMYDASAMQFE